MSEALYDAVARIARHESEAKSWAAIAVVSEVHTDVMLGADYAVTVRLRDSAVVVPRVPIASGALGLVATMAAGDLVLVVFADGDLHSAVVVGRLYHRDLAPPEHADGQIVLQLPPGDSAPAIDVLADPATPELTLKIGDATVQVTGKKATITIGDAELEVDGNSPASLSAVVGNASFKLAAGGDVEIEASNNLTLKGANVKIEGSGTVKISGATVDVN